MSAWGDAWGDSWGSSWGGVETPGGQPGVYVFGVACRFGLVHDFGTLARK